MTNVIDNGIFAQREADVRKTREIDRLRREKERERETRTRGKEKWAQWILE